MSDRVVIIEVITGSSPEDLKHAILEGFADNYIKWSEIRVSEKDILFFEHNTEEM